ncbi:MAG: hypothetical protein AC479_06765 [miscellaneous Crenarchaeota group-6 archaeon AD8-1]|nr:MAG: hypothetical protein AC479_06765 [miscellaneous Crenarchaeota group-6 archaeon AD8-1]
MAEIKELKEDLESVRIRVSKPVLAFLAILFGILVFVLPSFQRLIIGSFFIIQGIILFSEYSKSRQRR